MWAVGSRPPLTAAGDGRYLLVAHEIAGVQHGEKNYGGL
jgi:hypothetical protein